MLEIRGLSIVYGQHKALQDASLRVGRGEIVVILGSNGAGKSSLLKAISGISEGRVTGSILMEGEDIAARPAHRIVEAGIALVPEGRGVFADLAVEENLMLGANPDRARQEASANLDRVLSLFPRLAERRRQIVRTMSGGEQQMVAIGRAMMSSPVLLTLDEPSLGLSPLLSKELFQTLRRVRDTGIGILLVEQNARASLAIADRGYLIENGRITHSDTAEKLRRDPAVQAAYLGGGAQAPRPHAAAAPTARSAVPAEARMPQPAPSAPPRTGPSPADIAASALAGLAAPARSTLPNPTPVPAAASAPSAPPPRAPSPASRPAAAAAPVRPTGRGDQAFGLSISDLVAQASQESRGRYGAAAAPGPARHSAAPRPALFPREELPSARPTVSGPSGTTTGDNRDRIAAVIREIEEAARQARRSRHERRPR